MGKLILCSGERTNKPYGFTTGIRIYSMEELCYYLYHHVYMIDENLLSDELFDWIEAELNLPDRAGKLKLLKKQKVDIKTLVTVILCSTDYYTEAEIKNMLKLLDSVQGMSSVKRKIMKANICLKNNQLKEAVAEYERIINSQDASELTPEEYGDLFHNMAVAKVHINGFKEASRLYYQAYERNCREESLRQYLYTLRLSNNEKGYIEAVEAYQVSEELKSSIENYLHQKEEEAGLSLAMEEIELLKNKKAIGKMSEYYKKTDEILNTWKSKLR